MKHFTEALSSNASKKEEYITFCMKSDIFHVVFDRLSLVLNSQDYYGIGCLLAFMYGKGLQDSHEKKSIRMAIMFLIKKGLIIKDNSLLRVTSKGRVYFEHWGWSELSKIKRRTEIKFSHLIF